MISDYEHEERVMTGRLESKVAIITGAGTGIGEAIAHKFAMEGARVIVSGLADDPIEDVARSIRENGGDAIPKVGDVSDENSAWACVELALTRFKRIDILINNAGVFLDNVMTEDYPLEDFDRTIRMNIRSAFMMTRFALPHLQKTRGNIVSAGSESGMIGLAQNTVYGGTTIAKGPVGDMVPKSLRREPKGVLEVKHQRDGLRNKQTHRIKAKEEVGSRK